MEKNNEQKVVNFNKDFFGTGLNFPKSVIPEKLKAQFRAYAKYDDDIENMVTHLAFAGMGAALSNVFEVKVDNENWIEKPTVFAVALASPGSNKSGVISTIERPFMELQREIDEQVSKRKDDVEYHNKKIKEMNRYYDANTHPTKRGKHIEWMNDMGLGYLYKMDGRADAFSEAPEPKHYEILLQTGTTEKRERILSINNGKPCVIIRDEFRGLFNEFNQYRGGKGSDLQSFLKLFDYKGNIISNISGRYSYDTKTVSVIGTSQFSEFAELFENKRNTNNGLIHRFLVVDATTHEGPNPFDFEENSGTDDLDIYNKFVRDMLSNYNEQKKNEIITLKFTKEALAYIKEWRNNTKNLYYETQELMNTISYDEFKEFRGKFDRYLTRFSIIMRAFRFYFSDDIKNQGYFGNPDEPITIEDVMKAEKLTMFYFNNAINFLHNINPFGTSKIKDEKEIKVIERMITNTTMKEVLAIINKVYDYRSSSGTNASARRKLNDFIDRKLINKRVTPKGETVYNSTI